MDRYGWEWTKILGLVLWQPKICQVLYWQENKWSKIQQGNPYDIGRAITNQEFSMRILICQSIRLSQDLCCSKLSWSQTHTNKYYDTISWKSMLTIFSGTQSFYTGNQPNYEQRAALSGQRHGNPSRNAVQTEASFLHAIITERIRNKFIEDNSEMQWNSWWLTHLIIEHTWQ